VRRGDLVFIRYGVRLEPTEDLESVMLAHLPGFPQAVEEWKRFDMMLAVPYRVSEIQWSVDEVLEEGVVSVCVHRDPKGEFSGGEFCAYAEEGDLVV